MTSKLDLHDARLSRRRALELISATAGASVLPMFSVEAAPLAYTLKPIKVVDGVWQIKGVYEPVTTANGGAIANSTILDSSEGAIIIDTGPSKRFGLQLAALAKELTGKGIARAYLTHIHPDHAFGCQAFEADQIAGTEGTVAGLKTMGESFANAMYALAGDWMRGTEVVLPGHVVTAPFEDIGNRRLRLLRMKGHTASDLVVFDEKTGIVVSGDIVFLDRAPTTPQATIPDWKVSLANLGGIPFSTMIPGHGPAEESVRGIEMTRRWITEIEQIISGAYERGLDMTEAMALPLPAWTEPIAMARYEYARTVQHLYPKIEAARLPLAGGKI